VGQDDILRRVVNPRGAPRGPASSSPVRGILLREVQRAGAAYDAEARVSGACALFILELGLDVVVIFLALVGEDSAGVFLGGDYARGGQLGAAVLRDLAFDQQVAGRPRRAALSAKTAVLDDAHKLPGVALGVPFCGADELGRKRTNLCFSR